MIPIPAPLGEPMIQVLKQLVERDQKWSMANDLGLSLDDVAFFRLVNHGAVEQRINDNSFVDWRLSPHAWKYFDAMLTYFEQVTNPLDLDTFPTRNPDPVMRRIMEVDGHLSGLNDDPRFDTYDVSIF